MKWTLGGHKHYVYGFYDKVATFISLQFMDFIHEVLYNLDSTIHRTNYRT